MAAQYAGATEAYRVDGTGGPSVQMLMKAQADTARLHGPGAMVEQPEMRPVLREMEGLARDISTLETTWREIEQRLTHVLAPEEPKDGDTLAKGYPDAPASPIVCMMQSQRRAIRMLNVAMSVTLAKLEV